MRIAFVATLFSATLPVAAVASADEMNYGQAAALAAKDSATLSVDQLAAIVESESKAWSAVRQHCPEPVRKADFEPFTVIMELDASGKITRTWLKGDTAVAICFNKGLGGQTLAKPPHAPFYASYDMYWQQ
ncbi:MAG TPA: hypothetical protein VGH80_14845 [Xanthomonadaceae bacterium]